MSRASSLVQVMMAAARKAARGLMRDFGEVANLQVSRKGPADFVTAADRRAEEVVRGELARARPKYGFLMEEAGEIDGADSSNRWVVDPLDGTTNFLHGLGHFAISIGLERDGKPHAGVVYDPVKDETFWAEKGEGAFLNDRRMRVSARKNLTECLVACGAPFAGTPGHARFLRELSHVLSETAGVRRQGAAALDLAYVAAGRFDAFWERNLNAWDVCAGIVLVREAGGFAHRIGEAKGEPTHAKEILAGNPEVHERIREILHRARAEN